MESDSDLLRANLDPVQMAVRFSSKQERGPFSSGPTGVGELYLYIYTI